MPRFAALLLLLLAASPLPPLRAQALNLDGSAVGVDVQVSADKSEYSGDLKEVALRGNAVIRRGAEILRADEIRYNQETRQASARGNVSYENGVERWTGTALDYNFQTRVGTFGLAKLDREPFHVRSARSRQLGPDHFRLEDVTISTCKPEEEMEAWVEASSADVLERRIVKARNVVFYHQGIPFLYLPSYTLDLDREPTHFDVLPGYSSRNGPFVLSAYTIPLGEEDDVRSITHLDYRQERGLALGQDFTWLDRPDRAWEGLVTGYYAQDDKPYRNARQEEEKRKRFIEKDEDRYRLRLRHSQSDASGDSFHLDAGYLSDAEVIQDFFDEEYRLSPEPVNRLSYSHNTGLYSAGVEVNHQINDDYFNSVNRHPEVFLNFNLSRIPGTDLYYRSENSASVLERTYNLRDRSRGLEDYDTQRIHTSHALLYPTKHFGWLNLIPRAGYTGTWYADTVETRSRRDITSSVSTNGVVTFTTNTVNEVVNTGADIRHLPELGAETSFKAFKVLHNDPLTNGGIGLRHVVEPFADYSYIPEPDLRPLNIPQFDRIDELDRRHDVIYGVRNKLQTRHQHPEGAEVVDIIDFNVYTAFLLDPEETEEEQGDIFTDTQIQLNRHLYLDFENRYNVEEGEFVEFNSRAVYRADDRSHLSLDHRYRPDVRNLVQASYSFLPEARFSFGGYTRYDFETSEMEEQQVHLAWKRNCVGYGLGVKWISGDIYSDGSDEDDWQVWGQVWLTAFPRSRLDIGR
jgi:lipopolysaccharide assembly outer membrane protein LptD (OstA)